MARAPPLQGGCRGFESLWAHVNKPTVNELAEILNNLFPPNTAQEWDVVGLLATDSNQHGSKILLTIDPTLEVIKEAQSKNTQLIISHHPLSLIKDEVEPEKAHVKQCLKYLKESKISLYTAHTNADVAKTGVSFALAKTFGLENITEIDEAGFGCVGNLEKELKLEELILNIQEFLPATKSAIQVSGNLDKKIKKVAVCGGSGSFLLDKVREINCDVFITADLKHHAVSDNRDLNGPALISVSHWASEWPWLPVLAKELAEIFIAKNYEIEIEVSIIVTDPWTSSISIKS